MSQIVSQVIDAYVYRHGRAGPEFLLLKRSPTERLPNTWQAVHGHIEPPETAVQAALREIREETAFEPIRLFQIDTVHSFFVASTDTIHLSPVFAAEVSADSEPVLNPEHAEYRWCGPDEATASLLWPGQKSAVREIMDYVLADVPAGPYLEVSLTR
jgi:8-oxo-dGTP pyrophosphatase MutT (NUDIX family)